MKFTPKEDFRHGYMTFEDGNAYEPAKHGLSDEDVKRFHSLGWAEVEGMDPAPDRQARRATVHSHKSSHDQKG